MDSATAELPEPTHPSDSDAIALLVKELGATELATKDNETGEIRCPFRFAGGRTYWTVIVPFMFIARCGVQWYSYLPGGTFANEIV